MRDWIIRLFGLAAAVLIVAATVTGCLPGCEGDGGPVTPEITPTPTRDPLEPTPTPIPYPPRTPTP